MNDAGKKNWAQLKSIDYAKSIHRQGQYGTAKRPFIVSRKMLEKSIFFFSLFIVFILKN